MPKSALETKRRTLVGSVEKISSQYATMTQVYHAPNAEWGSRTQTLTEVTTKCAPLINPAAPIAGQDGRNIPGGAPMVIVGVQTAMQPSPEGLYER